MSLMLDPPWCLEQQWTRQCAICSVMGMQQSTVVVGIGSTCTRRLQPTLLQRLHPPPGQLSLRPRPQFQRLLDQSPSHNCLDTIIWAVTARIPRAIEHSQANKTPFPGPTFLWRTVPLLVLDIPTLVLNTRQSAIVEMSSIREVLWLREQQSPKPSATCSARRMLRNTVEEETGSTCTRWRRSPLRLRLQW